MAEEVQYLVRISGDTAYMSVLGKATYLNCKEAGQFFNLAVAKNCRHLRLDFYACTGMDSTFMGMVAGATLKLASIGGTVTLYNLKARNLELIENVGLNHILKISEDCDFNSLADTSALPGAAVCKDAILEAHENLISANPDNARKFEDVIKFLKAEDTL